MSVYIQEIYVDGMYVMQVTLFIGSFQLFPTSFIKQFKLKSKLAFLPCNKICIVGYSLVT